MKILKDALQRKAPNFTLKVDLCHCLTSSHSILQSIDILHGLVQWSDELSVLRNSPDHPFGCALKLLQVSTGERRGHVQLSFHSVRVHDDSTAADDAPTPSNFSKEDTELD